MGILHVDRVGSVIRGQDKKTSWGIPYTFDKIIKRRSSKFQDFLEMDMEEFEELTVPAQIHIFKQIGVLI